MKKLKAFYFMWLLLGIGLVQAQTLKDRLQVGGHFSLDAHSNAGNVSSFNPFYRTPLAYSVGLHTNFKVTPSFSIMTGLGYSQAIIQSDVESNTPEFGSLPATLNRVIRDLEVPLLLYVRPFGKADAKFSITFSGGVVMGFALQQYVELSGPPNTFENQRFDIDFDATPERLKLQLGIGLNWRISNKTNLLLEPVARYDFVQDEKTLTTPFAAVNSQTRVRGIRLLVNYQL